MELLEIQRKSFQNSNRYNHKCQRLGLAFTLVELLVVIAILLLIVSAIFKVFLYFSKEAKKEELKAESIQQLRETFRLLEDDIRHASFGYPGSLGIGKGICRFVIERCYSSDSEFCLKGTSLFFASDGWQIIRDFTKDNCPDGDISDADYEYIIGGSGFYANVTNYTSGDKKITIDKLDIDNKALKTDTFCGVSESYEKRANDFKAKKAIIVCGCKNNSGNFGQEGRRITKIVGNNLIFHSKSTPLSYKYCSTGKVIPAVVWYVREKNGIPCLYRNEKLVLQNVEYFKVHVGYDDNNDGIVEDSEWINREDFPPNATYKQLKFFWFEIKTYYVFDNRKFYIPFTLRVSVR